MTTPRHPGPHPRLTLNRSALLVFVVAVLVHVGALRNEWAMDDADIVENNPTVRSPEQALGAFFEPYWPEASGIPGGQYRPFVILWYSMDWALSRGSAVWLHAVNVLVHGLAAVLLVFVIGRWLPPMGAAIAGLVFAVHPVHVEAVANVVGRAEVATAVFLLAAILAARRYRASWGARRTGWLLVVVVLGLLGLFTKEHAVVLVVLLVIDEFVGGTRKQAPGHNLNLYLALGAATIAWLFLWAGVAGAFVTSSETPALRGVGNMARLATMFPTYLEVTRLLVWPFDLSPDYNPQMIPQHLGWSVGPLLGLVYSVAVVALAVALRKRVPAIAVGILCSLVVYAPTSNFLFATGVLLAERNLYLSVWAPAVIVGWLACNAGSRELQRAVYAAIFVWVGSMTLRTVQRVPEWENTEQILTGAFAEHPDNYRGHLRVATLFMTAGDSSKALAQALVGGAIFPGDPFANEAAVPLAMALGYPQLAVREAERSLAIGSDYPAVIRSAVEARLNAHDLDSALGIARMGVDRHPQSPMAAEVYLEVLEALNYPFWVKELALARDRWLWGEVVSVMEHVHAAVSRLPEPTDDSPYCWDLARSRDLVNRTLPQSTEYRSRFGRVVAACRD